MKVKDRRVYSGKERYKALTPESKRIFLKTLNEDASNFLKPLCYVLLFAGLRIGEALALQWKNVNFEEKTLKIERSVTQNPKFDSNGKILSRVTVIGDTKTTCSVREVPITDIVVNTLKEWKEKQTIRERTNRNVTAELTVPTSFIFANDDGSVRILCNFGRNLRHSYRRYGPSISWAKRLNLNFYILLFKPINL